MKNKNYTWVIKNKEGVVIKRTSQKDCTENLAIYYGKLEDIIKLITYKEWLEMETLEIFNNTFDNVKHKPITKKQIEQMLKESE